MHFHFRVFEGKVMIQEAQLKNPKVQTVELTPHADGVLSVKFQPRLVGEGTCL